MTGPNNDIKLIIDVDKLVDIHLRVTHGGELLVNNECKYPENPEGTQYL